MQTVEAASDVHLDIDYLQLSVTVEGQTAEFETQQAMNDYLSSLWEEVVPE